MATATANKKIKIAFNTSDFIATAFAKVSESVGDMVVTVAVTGITMAVMHNITPAVYANTLPGLYIAAMIVQLFIRIVHRFDENYTTDELAERVIELEQTIKENFNNLEMKIDDMSVMGDEVKS